MKAARIHEYGSADVIHIENIPIPEIADDEALVKIYASSVNPIDWKAREGYLKTMNIHKLPFTLGWDLSGIVQKLGKDVNNFKIGDEVYSRPALERDGTCAEFIAVKADELAFKPKTISHREAASVPLAGITAWETLITAGNISKGQKVLVHAASGGVGSFAVQLAKAKGCYVIGTCSTANINLVKSLGADEVIDYKTQDFSEILNDIDVVLDTIGGETQEKSWKVLKKDGILISIIQNPNLETAKKYGVRCQFVFIKPDVTALNELANLIDKGKIKPLISKVFKLDDIKQAHLMSETGRTKGKIVIDIV